MQVRGHIQATISYIEEAISDRQRRGLPQDHVTLGGRPVSFEDALAHLAQMRADGMQFVPCGCEGVDTTGRCPGWSAAAS